MEPFLATEWNQVEPTTWEFTLREDVSFQDDKPMDADAVAAAAPRSVAPVCRGTVRWRSRWSARRCRTGILAQPTPSELAGGVPRLQGGPQHAHEGPRGLAPPGRHPGECGVAGYTRDGDEPGRGPSLRPRGRHGRLADHAAGRRATGGFFHERRHWPGNSGLESEAAVEALDLCLRRSRRMRSRSGQDPWPNDHGRIRPTRDAADPVSGVMVELVLAVSDGLDLERAVLDVEVPTQALGQAVEHLARPSLGDAALLDDHVRGQHRDAAGDRPGVQVVYVHNLRQSENVVAHLIQVDAARGGF